MENKFIISIQKKFLLRRFNNQLLNCLNIINKLNNDIDIYSKTPPLFTLKEKYIADRYYNHMKLLRSKDTIILFNELIKRYYRYVKHDNFIAQKINARSMLVAWTIVSYPEYVLDNKRELIIANNDHCTDTFIMSMKKINHLNNYIQYKSTENMRLLIKSINVHINAFNNFLDIDRNIKIKMLTNEWYGLNKNIELVNNSDKYSDEQKNESIAAIYNTSKNIEKHIKSLSPSFDIKQLPELAKIVDAIDKNMIRAYTDLLKDSLINKQYDLPKKTLTEIKAALSVFNPNKKNELEQFVDIDFLIGQHQKDVISIDEVFGLGEYLVSFVSSMASIEADKSIYVEWNKIKNDMYNLNINDILSKIFIFVLECIEDIKENIINVKLALALGINVFEVKPKSSLTNKCM
jgi:hypothetical protein